MAEKYAPTFLNVDQILGEIKNNNIAIPEIQRPFVWSKSQVRDLLDSLYKGYPIGYLIIWRDPNVRLKDGTYSRSKKIIIDGQQRITALMTSIAGIEVINQEYKKERVKIAFNPFIALEDEDDSKLCFEVQTPAHVKDSKWIDDVSIIFDPNFNSFEFINNYVSSNPEMSENNLNKIIEKLKKIQNRQIGVIELSEGLGIDIVTEIFIRINSKGKKLDQSDFVMSKIASDKEHGGQELRKVIDYFAHFSKNPQDYETIIKADGEFASSEYNKQISWLKDEREDVFDPSYNDVIRVAFMTEFSRAKLADLVALLSGRDFEDRTYKSEIIDDTYTRFTNGVKKVINQYNFKNFMETIKGAGFISQELINSQTALDFAYTLYLLIKDDRNINTGEAKKIVQKWFVLSVLTGRYSGSSETRILNDLSRIKEKGIKQHLLDIESAELSDTFWDVALPQNLETTSNNSPSLQVYLAAQIFNQEKSLLSNSVSVRDLVELIGDIHHIFPRAYLKRNGFSKGKYNQNANYALLDTTVNKDIGDDAPNVYFAKAFKQCETKKIECGSIDDINVLKVNLKDNCIPEDILEMDQSRYEDFLSKRRKLMAEKIKNYYYSL